MGDYKNDNVKQQHEVERLGIIYVIKNCFQMGTLVEKFRLHITNTSLAAKGALANRLQRRNACNT